MSDYERKRVRTAIVREIKQQLGDAGLFESIDGLNDIGLEAVEIAAEGSHEHLCE